jgi:hypothetical protein
MNIQKIFITRERALYYDIHEYKKGSNSWIGGNAPRYFDKGDFFNDEKYYFYLTIQSPLNPDKQYSIFTPNFDIALEFNSYPECKVLLIEHELSEQSENDKYKHPEIDEIYEIYEIGEDKDGPEKNSAIKFGGKVIPIQWGLDNDGKVIKDGHQFIFQINEIGMGDIAEFMSGCLYVYGKLVDSEIKDPFIAYWEYS